ncbi:hypothetical protein [Maritimibacter alexandrii]|uniref:hypothetical protein n=1 Tax=Maritimibacter alexandrii TaxID=2570355 RepID=UPI0011085B36|nr:hypothetical protein [Maritimibacter alexandrii]
MAIHTLGSGGAPMTGASFGFLVGQICMMGLAGCVLTVICAFIVEQWRSPWMVVATITAVLFLGWMVPSPINYAAIGGQARPVEVRP